MTIAMVTRSFGRGPSMVGGPCRKQAGGDLERLYALDDVPLSHLSGCSGEANPITLGNPPSAPAPDVPMAPRPMSNGALIYSIVATASMAASAYHGYKRNDSVGWALWWGLMGSMFPVITPVIAVAQGFGEPEKTRAGNPVRRRRPASKKANKKRVRRA